MLGRFSLGKVVDLLPANKLLYRFCRHYVERYDGENNSDMYSNGELRMLRQVLPDCKVVFDVGANVGAWTEMALALNPQLQVHCFEPSRATFQQLQARCSERATCHNFGLSSARGEMSLWVYADRSGNNSLYRRQGVDTGCGSPEQHRAEMVRLDTVDAYCQRAEVHVVDLMKVDVEGHELEVFKGAEAMLAQGRIKRIQFEYGGCNIDSRVLLMDLFGLLTGHGYRLHKIHPTRLQPVEKYDQRLENFRYQNWVAFHA